MSALGAAAALWGVVGVIAILGQAIYRLSKLAIEPITGDMFQWWHWALWAGWMAFQLYAEGYRGFQRSFSPRVAARALYLGRNPRPLRVALAPLFCMSFFHATRARLRFQYVFVAALICVIVVVQQLPQPWRGLIDAGVVAGLVWGVIALVAYFAAGWAGAALPVSADTPDTETRSIS